MLDTDGRPSSVSLDLCLIWKHEIPSFFLKHEPKEPLKEVKDTPILPQPVRRTSKEFVVTPVKEAELHDAEPTSMPPKAPEPTTAPLRRLSTDSSDTSFSHSSKDLFSPPTNVRIFISIYLKPHFYFSPKPTTTRYPQLHLRLLIPMEKKKLIELYSMMMMTSNF